MASFWDFVPELITAGATLWGSSQSSKANQQAAQTASNATAQATQAETQATRDATAAQLEALRIAQDNERRMQVQASPGLLGMQEIIGRGDRLTPEQERAIADSRRTTLDALQGGSLRGSARATTAAVRDVEGRVRGGFIDQNQQRADQAAGNLSGQYFNAGNQVTNLFRDQGTTASQGLLGLGNIASQGATAQGSIASGNTLNQGAIQGKAIGDIGAVIADYMKTDDQKARDSSYTINVGRV